VLCIIAATVFWFFNALNKTYTTNINFPLRFEYDQENFLPVALLPSYVRLNVTGSGWELFKRSTGVKTDPLDIPLERPSEVKKIAGNGLPFIFSNQLSGLKINHVLSDTLFLDLEPKAGRWLKLTLDSVQFKLRAGYGLASEIAIIPDSTFVAGPERIINKLAEPVVLKIPHNNIDEHFIENIPVEVPFADMIIRQPPSVSVMFNVEEMITVTDSVSLEIINIPDQVSDINNTGMVPLTYSVPESLMPDLKRDSIKAVLDLKNFRRGKAKMLPSIKGLPPYSSVIKLDSIIVRL
jgi:hypothetical protein